MSRAAHLTQFYRRTVADRLQLLRDRDLLGGEEYAEMLGSGQVLSVADADKLIENVIGVFGLPMGLGLNFVVNGRDYVVPMVVEEPSIVAAVSAAAKLVRAGGGFRAESDEPLLIGQIQIVDTPHVAKARQRIFDGKEEIVGLANSLQPNMVARGGGVRDLEVTQHPSSFGDMLVVRLIVDTCDAMGANLVNTMCEGVAPLIEKLCEGRAFLRILSNLTDRAMVRAHATIPVAELAGKGFTGEQVRDGIVLATEFALVDAYRAVTHNKGVMNGIDAVALATGNDWRAIEAAAHAYAGRGPSYTSLTSWRKDEAGNLVGRIELPLKLGTVGGQVQSNPAVRIAHRLLGVKSARELAELVASVGLAQNLAALKALSTDGIQRGHMTLHARSCAAAAGASGPLFEPVVEKLVESGEIKVWKAREIVRELAAISKTEAPSSTRILAPDEATMGFGKVILIGDHAVVYGAHAVAAPLSLRVRAHARLEEQGGVRLFIPRWGIEEHLRPDKPAGTNTPAALLDLILRRLDVRDRHMWIDIVADIPRAMGLGGSAALAVAVIRAVASTCGISIDDARVNELAYECEKIAHGTPSGIDNTVATYGHLLVFKRGDPPSVRRVDPPRPLRLVVGLTNTEALTASVVAKVRAARELSSGLFDRLFTEIDGLALEAAEAIHSYDLVKLGGLMNVNQGLLNALGVSSAELEDAIDVARRAGALGAKLTGSGGGGAIVALAPDDDAAAEGIAEALRKAGYRAFSAPIAARSAESHP